MESAEKSPLPTSPAPDWLRDLGWAEVYEVKKMIGRGGMGRVYEGWHRQLEIPVALKIIDPHLVGEDHVRARFEKEAMTLARLQEPVPHPNIVRVIDFKLLDSVGCIVMAYVKGMDVRAWCVDRDVGLTQRVALMEQVARAAGYFHSFGLVHRDLKPANILVRHGSGDPVIVDFGIVRGREDVTLTRTQQALGTAAYMAPELLGVTSAQTSTRITTTASSDRPVGEISPAADVYSLGVMLYELLTGELPHGSTLVELLPRHQKEIAPNTLTSRPSRIPKDLERVCLKAISHRSTERYANGTEFAEDLARYLRGEPVLARPISKIRHAARRARRRPVLSMLALAGFIVALLAVTRLGWDVHQARLARLREEIGMNMPVTTWSTDMMLKTDRLIDELEKHQPEQAGVYHHTLIHGAIREVLKILGQPRISETERHEIEIALKWLQAHDQKEAARLRQAVEERQARWDTLLEITPPFQDLARQVPEARVEEGGVIAFTGESTAERMLMLKRPLPLDISTTFVIPAEGVRSLGFKVLLFDQWHMIQLMQPPSSSVLSHLWQFGQTKGIPEAVLVIARKDRIMAVAPLKQPPKPGSQLQMRMHIWDRRISLETHEGDRVEYRQRYQTADPVSVALVGVPSLRIQNLRWTGPDQIPASSPLEKGDYEAGSERWWAAEPHFLQLSGDPEYGAESLFKAGDCQFELGRTADAQATWEQVMRGPESPWRTEACLQLWYLHADVGRLDEARTYLDQLPGPEDMPADYLAQLQRPGRKLDDLYRSMGRGLNLLRPMPGVEDAVRVHRMLQYTPAELAARFALARHFNGTAEAARDLLSDGLRLKNIERLNPAEEKTINTNFELWSLMARSEVDMGLEEKQKAWLAVLPPDHSIAHTIQLDLARRLAREGRKDEALVIARRLMEEKNATIMTFTGAALLSAALDKDTARKAALQALQRVTEAPRHVHEYILLHRLLLHSLSKNWTQQTTVDILAEFLCLGESLENRETLRSRLCRLLLENRAMVNSLNHLLNDKAGDRLLQAVALRGQPARQVVHELFYMILRRYVIYAVFGPQAQPEQMRAAAVLTRSWLDCYGSNQISVEDFLLLMENLPARETGPLMKVAMPRWPESLQSAVREAFRMSGR